MDIKELISKRRTIRKFKQIPLENEKILSYIDSARLAPSAANLQPLKYAVVSSEQMCEKVFESLKWAGYLAPEYNPKAGERPVAYVIVCTDSLISKSDSMADVGAAVENLILSALADGVGSCWLGSVDKKAVSELLGLDENLTIAAVVALGYPAETPGAVAIENGDIKYYLDSGVLRVPKRQTDEIVLKVL